MTLGEAIKQHRHARKLSQTKLAALAGIGEKTIVYLESPSSNQRRKSATLITVAALARAMDISMSELLQDVSVEAVL
jgi:transcriptional regulator with XRE-family HTH domain